MLVPGLNQMCSKEWCPDSVIIYLSVASLEISLCCSDPAVGVYNNSE